MSGRGGRTARGCEEGIGWRGRWRVATNTPDTASVFLVGNSSIPWSMASNLLTLCLSPALAAHAVFGGARIQRTLCQITATKAVAPHAGAGDFNVCLPARMSLQPDWDCSNRTQDSVPILAVARLKRNQNQVRQTSLRPQMTWHCSQIVVGRGGDCCCGRRCITLLLIECYAR